MKKEIVFVTRHKGFSNIKEFQPFKASKYTPTWYKDMPTDHKPNKNLFESKLIPDQRTAKLCPSFHDVFSEGFILPAPCDIYLSVDGDNYSWKLSNNAFAIEIHGNDQMITYLPEESKPKQVFKLLYPYEVIVPKNYSIRQVPMIYDYNKDWHVAYGIFDAYKLPEVSLQIVYTSDKKEILIKAGTPLCYYVPFKKEKLDIKIGSFKDYEEWIYETQHRAFSSFRLAYKRWFK